MTHSAAPRPCAIVLHDDRSLASHVHGLLGSVGFAVELATTSLSLLRPRGEDQAGAALYVLAASALDRRDRELVTLLRETAPETTIVVLFPSNLRDTAAAMLEAGADASLSEPFYPGELAALARRALARVRHAADAPPPSGAPDRVEAEPGADNGLAQPKITPVQQVAVGVAHAIRNPLQIMELMLASAESGDDLDVEALRELMERIAGVVSDLSRFGDHTRSPSVRLDVAALVREVFDAVPAGAAPTLTLVGADEPIPVLAETELLRTALALLRDRALRDTPRDGAIGVRVGVAGARVSIAVSDGGATPEGDALVHFFEPAWDMDVVQAGTWIEMAALAGMIRSQGGTVAVAPGADHGVTVTIQFAIAGSSTDAV